MRISISPFFVAEMASLLLASCVNVEIAPQQFPYEAMIAATDLGPGWHVEHTSFPQVDGALSSYSVTFRYGDTADATQPGVAHQLTIYPDSESAKMGYMGVRDQFNLDRPSDPILPLRPQSEEDLADSHCERLRLNDQPRVSCLWVQRHRSMVFFVNGLVDGEALTLEELTQLIQVLDARLNKLDPSRLRSELIEDQLSVGQRFMSTRD